MLGFGRPGWQLHRRLNDLHGGHYGHFPIVFVLITIIYRCLVIKRWSNAHLFLVTRVLVVVHLKYPRRRRQVRWGQLIDCVNFASPGVNVALIDATNYGFNLFDLEQTVRTLKRLMNNLVLLLQKLFLEVGRNFRVIDLRGTALSFLGLATFWVDVLRFKFLKGQVFVHFLYALFCVDLWVLCRLSQSVFK